MICTRFIWDLWKFIFFRKTGKKGTNAYKGYNWKYDVKPLYRESLKAFNNGSGFIVGYIVW